MKLCNFPNVTQFLSGWDLTTELTNSNAIALSKKQTNKLSLGSKNYKIIAEKN